MNTDEIHDRYANLLMQRIASARFPSSQMMNRAESTIRTPEEAAEYVGVLLEKVESTTYPSVQMLDRIQRVLNRVPRAEEGQRLDD